MKNCVRNFLAEDLAWKINRDKISFLIKEIKMHQYIFMWKKSTSITFSCWGFENLVQRPKQSGLW